MLMLSLALAASSPAQEVQPIPSLEEATAQIERNDAQLFWGFFEGCDPDLVEGLLHPDYRMIHDLGGLVATSSEQLLSESRRQCAARQPGGRNEGYMNRRLLVPGSRTVTPLGEWGVLERGAHTFHELRMRPAGVYGEDDPGGPTWVQTGGANYYHVWQWMAEEGRFRLLESISVDHGAAPDYPPENAGG